MRNLAVVEGMDLDALRAGIKIFDGAGYCPLEKGPGHVLDRFLPTGLGVMRNAAD